MRRSPTRRLAIATALAVLCALPVSVITTTLATAATPTGDWKQLRYDETHTGFNPGETILDASNVGSLIDTYGLFANPVSPVVEHDKVIVCKISQCLSDAVFAQPDAVIKWRGWGVHVAYLTIGGDRIFQTRLPGHSSVVEAVDLETGDRVGTVTLPGGIVGPATYHNGHVFVTGARGRAWSLDSASLAIDWTSAKAADLGTVYSSGPTIAFNRVYASACTQLVAVKGDTGTFRWSAPLPGSSGSHCGGLPAAVDRRVFVATSSLTAYDYASGSQVWTVTGDGGQLSDPAVAYGRVYTVSSGSAGAATISAYSEADGVPIWSAPTTGTSAPTVANGLVYVAGTQGLQVFEADTGVLVTTVAGDFAGEPVVTNGVVFVLCNSFNAGYDAVCGLAPASSPASGPPSA